jgi:nicotinate-nucleotide--dimethylbenzimidazole phosphoribosyltransferase
MTVRLVRHGATQWTGLRYCGRTDLPLTAEGEAQAAAIAQRLAGTLVRVVRSSPARRALDTARVVADALGVPVEVDERLLEADFGAAEGLRPDELERAYPAVWRALEVGRRYVDWPEGEGAAFFRDRVRSAARDLARGPEETVIVSHGGVMRALAAELDSELDASPGPGEMVAVEPGPIARVAAAIAPLDETAARAAEERQRSLTKPAGSLGRLEEIAVQIAGITGSEVPAPRTAKAVIVMAADHGVAAEGVSAYPQAVTPQMVENFLRGGAAINALARAAGARVVVVDMGIATPLSPRAELVERRIGPGTHNLRREPAMSRSEAHAAVAAGASVLEDEAARGLDLVATGDMGIGNTTAASAVVAALTGRPVAELVGRGTGIDDAAYANKIHVIEDALGLHEPDPLDAMDVLAKVGGYEIGGLAGVMIAAAARRIPVVLDGFISGAAALLAAEIEPACVAYFIAAHRSVEIGHRVVLDRLGLRPLLDLDMRLGEGTGAALAMPIIDAALRAHREMATFAEANVSERGGMVSR